MTWLVFDCPSGISGDMTLGALVDLGVPVEHLRGALATLPLRGWGLRAEQVHRSSIAATRLHVDIESAPPGGGATFAGGHQHEHRHLAKIVLNETTTLGVRIAYEERLELERLVTRVQTPFGEIQVKVALRPDGGLRPTRRPRVRKRAPSRRSRRRPASRRLPSRPTHVRWSDFLRGCP